MRRLATSALCAAFSSLLLLPVLRAEETYAPPEAVARLRWPDLVEASGLAAARRSKGLYWTHNDSGDRPRLFAFDDRGKLRAELRVRGAEATDWEDIATGPGPSPRTPYLYIADTGNNALGRRQLTIWRFPEPEVSASTELLALESEPAEGFSFRFADGVYDCESLVVHPSRPEVYLFTKKLLGVGVYKLDVAAAGPEPLVALPIVHLPVASFATSAALSADGERLALRFYWAICEYRAPEGKFVVDHLSTLRPQWLPVPPESQGEAIAYERDGSALLTLSEGREPALYAIRRVASGGAPSGEDRKVTR
jgi:hypothetical protein